MIVYNIKTSKTTAMKYLVIDKLINCTELISLNNSNSSQLFANGDGTFIQSRHSVNEKNCHKKRVVVNEGGRS